MKRISRISAILLCLAMAISATACSSGSSSSAAGASSAASAAGSGQGTYNWKFGTVDATTNANYQAFQKLGEYLDEAAPGKWKIDLYPSSQLGDADAMLESLKMGTLELTAPPSSTVANSVPEYGIWDMPYLLSDYDHVDKVLDGEIGKEIGEKASSANIKFLGWMEVGFRCLANNKRAINSVDDVAGLRLRVMSNEIQQALFTALGADPVPMSLSDAYVANQNGTIDGQDNPLQNLIANSTYEVCHYIAVTNHIYSAMPLCMSVTAWNSMSPEDQQTFMNCVQKTITYQRSLVRESNSKAADKLVELGCEVTTPDLAPFAAKMQSVYDKYPQYSDYIQKIKAVQ